MHTLKIIIIFFFEKTAVSRLKTDTKWENISFPNYNRWVSYSDFKVIQNTDPRQLTAGFI